MRRTPLYEQHAAAGARFVPFAGFEMPVQYTAGLVAEHKQVRAAVGLFDVSHMGELRYRGPGAEAAVERVFSNSVHDLPVGQARYGLWCNEQGGVVDDVVVYRLAADDLLVCVNAANRDKDRAWAERWLPDDGSVTLTDEGDLWAQIAVQGPRGVDTLQPLVAEDLSGVKPWRVFQGAVAGVAGCVVARTGYTGEDGFEVFVPVDGAVAVWRALLDAGAPYGVLPIGLGARDTLRLESRLSLYGRELTDETSPGAARVWRFVKPDKAGGFVGRDAVVARKDADPLVLVGAVMDDKRIVREGMAVLHDGVAVGHVTSGTQSPLLGRGVALAYVPRALDVPGGKLTFDVRGKATTGTIVKGAFHKIDLDTLS